MKIHYLQHVHFEDPANIEQWAKERNYQLSGTKLFQENQLPSLGEFDWLVVMGGPMNIYEEEIYPWLAAEKKFIAQAIAAGKQVLGICLGAQLIAAVLGAKIYGNENKEIGWYPVRISEGVQKLPVFSGLPQTFTAFHWHGDTFELPAGSVRAAHSEGCINQAFAYNDGKVIGLQFHLESSHESVAKLVDNCGDELVGGKYIQSAAVIQDLDNNWSGIREIMARLLDNIVTLITDK
jgi:GMP synthase (glutamine-hydrolysing)